ncbi:hypothetical protein ALC53_13394 [Atta colombica]|uniref:Uncharacterized protein n=1 Tax=Atta colombica TaxID=520822 RepID=A0A195AWE0_9HYME|nr:hypothetical protein ALC53_13394 [Atta colombica]
MWLTPRSNRAFAGFLHPEMQRKENRRNRNTWIYADRAQKSGSREARKTDEQERIMCRKGTCLFRACYLPIERSQEKQLDSS